MAALRTTEMNVNKLHVNLIKAAILNLPDETRLTGPYAELWAMMLQAEDRIGEYEATGNAIVYGPDDGP